MSRVRRGFKLAGVSWKVIVAEPAILAVLAVGLVGMVVVSGGLFLLLFRRIPDRGRLPVPELPDCFAGAVGRISRDDLLQRRRVGDGGSATAR